MIEEAARAALTVLFGALAGGITNTVAIWMLFHPYEPPRLFGRRLPTFQGAIPKNKARLAATIGRTVGTRLLTPEDLARTVAAPAFREAFDERLRAFLATALERRRGPLVEELPAPVLDEVRRLLEDAAATLGSRITEYVQGDEFRAAARSWAASLADELGGGGLHAVLTPERQAALTTTVDRWLADIVEAPGFERAVRDAVDRAANRWLRSERTLEELLPARLVGAIEGALLDQIPAALDRLGRVLEDPGARAKVQSAVHEVLERFVRDLRFHQRLVAALLITPDTIDRILRAVESEGAAKIAEVLQEPTAREAVARSVADAVAALLRRRLGDVLGTPDSAAVEDAKATLCRWVLTAARDPRTRGYIVERLELAWASAESRSWDDLFRHLPPERLGDAITAAARTSEARTLYAEALKRLADTALNRPIGRPADYLPPQSSDRLEGVLADPLWSWLQEQVPPIAQRVDIARRVEDKILEYPTPQLEQLIRGVTQRELKLIVRLGYALGAFIGLVLVGVNLLLG